MGIQPRSRSMETLTSKVVFRASIEGSVAESKLFMVGSAGWLPDTATPLTFNEEHGVWEAEITVTIGQPLYYNYITLDPQTRLIRWEDSPVRTCIFSEFSRVVNDIVPFPQKNETSTWSHNEGWITTETQLRLSFGYGDVTTGPLLSPLSMEKTYFDIQLRISCGTQSVMVSNPKFDSQAVLFAPSLRELKVTVDLLGRETEEGAQTLIARGYISPASLVAKRGQLDIPLVGNDLSYIGEFRARYLIVEPFVHKYNNLFGVRDGYVETTKPCGLIVGHRGCGTSDSTVIRENTILSFQTAAKTGIPYLEFDIQMTKDAVPVIHHDFVVPHTLTNGSRVLTPISSISLKEFKRSAPARSPLKRSRSSTQMNVLPTRNNARRTSVNPYDEFPTLEAALKEIPSDVGFLIEIKYPSAWYQQSLHMSFHERNVYVDAVLRKVFDTLDNPTHAKRRCIFISFDPDVVLLLSQKQVRYPVMFLMDLDAAKNSKLSEDVDITDSRAVHLDIAIEFVKANRIKGIITDAVSVLQDKTITERIHKAGLLHFTYGRLNADPKNRHAQLCSEVDSLIVDNVLSIACM